MNMKEKTKRYLVIGCGTVICVVLVAAISMQFKTTPTTGDTLTTDNAVTTEIIVNPSEITTESSGKAELVIETSRGETEKETDSTKPVDTRPAQTDQTEQSIQPQVTRPAEPEKEVKTDPTQKPDGTKIETPPTPVEHESVVPPKEPETTASQPQGGDTNSNGQTYFPGFGWVDGTGDSQGTTAADMYENGNKIGDMGN